MPKVKSVTLLSDICLSFIFKNMNSFCNELNNAEQVDSNDFGEIKYARIRCRDVKKMN